MFEDGRRPASLLGERRQRARRGRARAGRELRGAVECRHIDVSWIDVVVDVDSEEMVLVEDLCVCVAVEFKSREAGELIYMCR